MLALLWSAGAAADYKTDIGYTQLSNELGGGTPTGAEVQVTQVEADSTPDNPDYYSYLPDKSNSQFSGKNFTFYLVYKDPDNPQVGISGHATTVGQYFFGNTTSIAPGITAIDNYLADQWLEDGFLNTGYAGQPLATSARVANHSWVGYYNLPATNSEALRRLDWVIHRDEYIQAVGMNNGSGSATEPLLGSSFNAIAVGLSNGDSKHGSYAVDSLYTTGRTRPDLVAPADVTSYATPMVAAAAALLVQVGHAGGTTLSTDPLVKSTKNRNNDTIYNAERSEVVKAALMAGASRRAISGYSVNTDNGLNEVYGAGQLNIYHSYHIIAAGEQNSLEDGGAGLIGRYGFDYDPYFGGAESSNRTASYYFTGPADGEITASLVWNLAVDGGTPTSFDGSATFYHLGLYLYDLTVDPNNPVASADGDLDNTENIWWTGLVADHDYLLQVMTLTSGDFLWDYGLAWNIVPVPGAVYLLGTGILILVGFRRRSRG